MLETKESLGFFGYRHHSSKHLVKPIFPDGSPSQIIGGENVYHHDHTLKTFPGCEKLFSNQLGSASKRRCLGAFPYIDGSGNFYLILCYADKIYKYAPGDTSPTEIQGTVAMTGSNTDYFDSTYWVDTTTGYDPWIIMTNGVNPPIYWNGSGNCATLGGSPPAAKYVAAFAGHCFLSHVTTGATYSQRDQRSDVDEADDWAGGFAGSNDLRQSDGGITGSLVFGDLRFVFKEYNTTICRATGYDPPLLYEQDEMPIGCIAPKTLIKVWRHDYGFFMGNDLNLYLVAKDGSFVAIGDDITHKIRAWSNDSTLGYSFAVYYPEIDHIILGVPTTDDTTNFCDTLFAFDLGRFLETGEKIWSTPINTGINFTAGTVLRFRQSYKIEDLDWISTDQTIGGLTGNQIKDFFSEAAFSEVIVASDDGYVYRFDATLDAWDATTVTWEIETKDYRLTENRQDNFRLQEYELEYENPVNTNATAQVEISTDGGENWDTAISFSLVGTGDSEEELADSAWTDSVGKKYRFKVSGTYPLELHGQRFHGTNEGRW